jgi:D-alanyl-D-alanine carboxypeptidase
LGEGNFKVKYLLRIALLFWVAQTASGQTFNSNLGTKLQMRLDSMVTMFSFNTKGISASVYCPGQGIWKGVSGISFSGHPITSDMEFGIASNSKLFTAVTMLILAENNILSLNDPLSKWLPDFTNVNSSITIRQLLNHTSGVSDPFFTTHLLDTIQKYPTHHYTPEEVLSLLEPPLFTPGTGYGYSNINYILAGMVAKSATGNNISKLIRDSILTPLHLDSTFYDLEESEIGTLAHRWTGDIAIDLNDTSRISLNTAGGPAGSIFSTAGDMAQWYRALMSNQVINESSFTELTTFALPGNYGLGLQQSTFYERTTWGHAGSTIGYKSRVIYDPCMRTFVCCLANADWAAVDGITAMLYKLLIDNLPDCAGIISGTTSVNRGQNSILYTVPAITHASSYSWTLPSGATGTSATNSISVNYGTLAVSGTIKVKGQNEYGDGAESSLAISVSNNGISENFSLDNLKLTDGESGCFNAYDTITISGEGNKVEFQSGSSINLIAGGSVIFLPGFHAFEGSYMRAYITADSSFCDGASGIIAISPVIKNLKDKSLIQIQPAIRNEKSMKIYPNPNNGNFTIEFSNWEIGSEITVFNMMGKSVYWSYITEQLQQRINLGKKVKGFYIVKISDGKELNMKKIVVND